MDKFEDSFYKETLIDSLCKGITNVSEFREGCYYIIENKLSLNIPIFDKIMYKENDDSEWNNYKDLVLPCFRRIWAKIYIDIPDIFKSKYSTDGLNHINMKRLDLYQNLFNIDDFFNYLIEMFEKTKNCLSEFNNLDKTTEHLSLICENYSALLLKKTIRTNNIERDIRDAKLKKIIK